MHVNECRTQSTLVRFCVVLSAFTLLFLVSWPVVFSLDLWAFADRGSLLNLDYLLEQHLRLGVDTFYSYGLLPVLIQHGLFAVFGRGYGPMVGCTVVVMLLMALWWARLLAYVNDRLLCLVAVVALTSMIFWVNPNFPYSLVDLSMMAALLLVLEGRTDLAFAASTFGCFSVPSLPLALTGLLALLIVLEWRTGEDRSPRRLVRLLAPGVVTYAALAMVLMVFFGVRSVLATATPLSGMKFYYGANSSGYTDLIAFLHPAHASWKHNLGYYIGAPATWWAASSIALVVMAFVVTRQMLASRTLDSRRVVVVLCAILQVLFAAIGYRQSTGQHALYDPITAAGTLLGLSLIDAVALRRRLILAFAVIGALGQMSQGYHTLQAWRETRPSTWTSGLYADRAFVSEWSRIIEGARGQRLLLLSYGTGVHHYFNGVNSPRIWFLRTGLMLVQDHERVLAQIRDAEVVAQDLDIAPEVVDYDDLMQRELRSMCLTEATKHFLVWRRHELVSPQTACLENPRIRSRVTESSVTPPAPLPVKAAN